jgi:hypothetical protein
MMGRKRFQHRVSHLKTGFNTVARGTSAYFKPHLLVHACPGIHWFQQGVRFLDSKAPSVKVGRSDQVCPKMRLRHNLINTCRHTLAQQIVLEVIMFSSNLNPVLDGSGQPWGVTAGS